MSERVTLVIGGKAFTGWTSVEVFRSLEQAASSFSLTAPGQSPAALAKAGLRPGAKCRIEANGDALLSGHVDAVKIIHSGEAYEVQIRGRSKTADLVDCAVLGDSSEFRNQTIEQIAATMASAYGVDVSVVLQIGDTVGDRFKRHRIDVGETVHESIERLARVRALLVTDNAEGELVLTRAGAEAATTALRLGENILRGELSTDVSRVYSEYQCKGQRDGDDDDFGLSIVQAFGSATDPEVTRDRVLVVHAESKASAADCRRRAQWEAAARLGRSVSAQFDLVGWRQTDGGDLWDTNLLVSVDDERLGLKGAFLISGVRYRLDESGTLCRLEVVPPAAFALGDMAKRATKARAGVKGW